jgi:fructose-1,6-bisphosphatase
MATLDDGVTKILDVVPEKLHQRVSLVIGSKKDVEEFGKFLVH